MEDKNQNDTSNRHMVIFLGTSNDGIAAQQEVGCRIAETFKIPLAKVLAALMRVPFPVGRDLTLEAADDLVKTLGKLGAHAVTDSEGQWPSEARVLLNLQPSLPIKEQPSNAVGHKPSMPAQSGKSESAGKPAAAAIQVKATKPVVDEGHVAPTVQLMCKVGSSTLTGSADSEPSKGKTPQMPKPPVPEEKKAADADQQAQSSPAGSERIVLAVKPTPTTDQVQVTEPPAGDQCVESSVETEPDESLANGLTDIEYPDSPDPEEPPAGDGEKPRRLMKYLALAAAVLLLLAIGELVVSHTEWLPFIFGGDVGSQTQLIEQSALEKQLYSQAQTLEEFGSDSQMILAAWQDYLQTCPDGQYADHAQQQLSYWQDYRPVEPAIPPVTEANVPRAVKRELKPYLQTNAAIPTPDLDDPEPLWDPSVTTEVAAMENPPDWIVDLPSNSPLPDSPVRLGPGVTAPKVVYRVEPEFPNLARQVKASGEVLLQATILRDGSVSDVKVLQSPSRKLGCDKAAVEALKKWTFQPGMMHGQPVDVIIELKINFVP